jgi:hypothetical protein
MQANFLLLVSAEVMKTVTNITFGNSYMTTWLWG